MKLMELNDLIGHDVYEFCCAINYPNNWNDTSLFLTTEDFLLLSPYLDMVFPNYHYYGPQKITLDEWNKIKELYSNSQDKDALLSDFFIKIDDWLVRVNNTISHFWILGV